MIARQAVRSDIRHAHSAGMETGKALPATQRSCLWGGLEVEGQDAGQHEDQDLR